jgi:hypothetical protein
MGVTQAPEEVMPVTGSKAVEHPDASGHSKTGQLVGPFKERGSVVECGSPLPLWYSNQSSSALYS